MEGGCSSLSLSPHSPWGHLVRLHDGPVYVSRVKPQRILQYVLGEVTVLVHLHLAGECHGQAGLRLLGLVALLRGVHATKVVAAVVADMAAPCNVMTQECRIDFQLLLKI